MRSEAQLIYCPEIDRVELNGDIIRVGTPLEVMIYDHDLKMIEWVKTKLRRCGGKVGSGTCEWYLDGLEDYQPNGLFARYDIPKPERS